MLRDLRVGEGVTLRQLADKTGVHFTLLSKIETGLRPPPEIHVIFRIADVLGLTGETLQEFVRLATEPAKAASRRLSGEQLEKLRGSPSLRSFLRHRPRRGRESRSE
jgi:transcriptional regulator with XRE-family HTH domain